MSRLIDVISSPDRHEGCERGYYHRNAAWYHKAIASRLDIEPGTVDRVSFGYYHPEGGTTGELFMVWYKLGQEIHGCLECFIGDGMHALSTFGDLIPWLAGCEGVTPDQFMAMLDTLGFKDLTERTKPREVAHGTT